MPTKIDIIVGSNLRSKRALAGMTQAGLGEALDPPLTAQQISKYEIGTSEIGSTRLLELARVLSCPVTDLFVGVEEAIPPARSSRADSALMNDYQQLTPELQNSIRTLVHAMIKDLGNRYSVRG